MGREGEPVGLATKPTNIRNKKSVKYRGGGRRVLSVLNDGDVAGEESLKDIKKG